MTPRDSARYRMELADSSLRVARDNLSREQWREAALFARAAVENAAKAMQACFTSVHRTHDPDLAHVAHRVVATARAVGGATNDVFGAPGHVLRVENVGDRFGQIRFVVHDQGRLGAPRPVQDGPHPAAAVWSSASESIDDPNPRTKTGTPD